MPNKNNQKLLTIQESAKFLSLSEKTLRRWEQRGILIPLRTSGGHRRYSLEDLKNIRKENRRRKHSIDQDTNVVNQNLGKNDSLKSANTPEGIQEKPANNLPTKETFNLNEAKETIFNLYNLTPKPQKLFLILGGAGVISLSILFLSSHLIAKTSLFNNLKIHLQGNSSSQNQALNNLKKEVQKADESKVLAATSFRNISFNINVPSQFKDVATFVSDATINGNLAVNSGNINSSATTVNLVNSNVTTLNLAGAATTINVGSGTGNIKLNTDLTSIGTGIPTVIDKTGGDLFVTSDLEVGKSLYTPSLNLNGKTVTNIAGTGLQVSNGELQTTLGTAIDTSEITDGTILAADLNISNSGSNGQILSYNSSTGGFTWTNGTADLWTDAGAITYLTSTSDNLAVGGTTSSSPFYFNVSTGKLNATGDFQIGGIGLTDVGSSNTTSGASLIGVFGELTHSSSTKLQAVLKDLDSAIGAGSSKFTQQTGFIYLTTTTDAVTIGTNTQLGKLGVRGTSDQVQLYVQGNSSQTSNIAEFKNNGGSNLLTLDNSGNLTLAGSLTLGGDTISDFTGNGLQVSGGALTPKLVSAAAGLSSTTSSASGLEVLASGLTMIQGCSNGQLLKFNTTTHLWECANDTGASSAIINVQQDGSNVGTNVDTLNFENFFTLTTSPSSTVHINIANNSIDFAQLKDALTLDTSTSIALGSNTLSTSGTGQLNFSSTGQVTFAGNVAATNGLAVTNANLTVGGANFTVTPANGNVTTAGTLTLPNSNTLTGVANFVELNNGLSVGGGTTFFFNTSGNINANAGTFASTIAANGGLINSTGALNITPGGALTVGSTSQTTTLQGTTTSITSTSGNNISLNSALTVNSSGNLVTTGTADFRNAAGITLGEDKTAGTNNTPGFLKLISAGDNAFSTTFTTGTQTGNVNYTLPTNSGTNNFVLTTDGSGVLSWSSVSGVGGLNGSGTSGQIAFFNGASSLTSETTGFKWDSVNKKLGIGIDSPIGKVQVDTTGLTPIGKALLILNQAENQDILTASASGSTVLTVANSGNITTSGTVTLPNSNTLTGTTNYTQFSKGVSVGNATTFFFDTSGNLNANAGTFASTVTLPNSNTLTGVANFLQANNGFSVGGATTYYFNSSGTINANAETLASTLTLPNSNVLTGLSNYVQFAKGVSVGNATTFFFDTSGNINANAGTFASTIAANGGLINSTGALNITPGGALTVGSTSQTTTLQGTTTSITSTSGNNISLNSALTVNSSGNLVTTGTADFRNAAGITLGEDKTAGTNNTPGFLKLISAGDNAFSTTFTTGTQTGNVNYTLPTADGSNNFVLTTNGSGVLAWSSVSGVGGVNGTGASGQVTFWNGTSSITGNNNFFFDSTNTKLGIGTNSPLGRLGVDSTSLSPIGKALVALNQAENQDILTASASGVTKFTIGIDVASGNLETLTSNTITTGNVISATSSAITSGNLLKLAEGGNQTFSGNAILADIDNTGGGGNAFTGNFLKFNNNNSTVFTVAGSGNLTTSGTINLPNSNSLTGVSNFIEANNGFSVGGATTFYFNSSGSINAASSTFAGLTLTSNIATNANNTNNVGALGTQFANIYGQSIWQNSNQVCDMSGNCSGVGGGVTSPGGTANTVAKFTASQTIANSTITDNGTIVSVGAGVGLGQFGVGTSSPTGKFEVNNNGLSPIGKALALLNQTENQDILTASNSGTTVLILSNTGNLTLASSVANGDRISIVPKNSGSNTFTGTITSVDLTAARTWTFPDETGTICLTSGNCVGVGGQITGSGTAGQIAFFNGSGSISSETTGFAWDATNKKFGVGTDSPVGKVQFDTTGSTPLGKSLLVLNQAENQDILTASASGVTKFTIGIDVASGNLETLTSNTITTGNVISATSSAITSGNLLKLAEGGNQTFSGNAILADIDNTGGGGNAFTGNFLKFNNNNSTVFTVAGSGNLTTSGTVTLPNSNTLTGTTNYVQFAKGISVGNGTTNFFDTSGNINANAETLTSTLTLPNSNTLTGVANFVELNNGLSVGGGTTFFFNTSGNINANAGTFASTIAANGGLINSTGALNITPGGALTVGSTSQTTTLQGTTTSITSTSGNNISLNSALTVNSSGNLVTTGTADFRNAAGITLGEDKTAGTNNTPGFLKLISAGDNAFSTTFTTGTQTGNVNYTLPTNSGTNNFVLTTDGSGVLSWSSVSGVGGLNGSGTSGQIAFFNGASSLTSETTGFKWDSVNKKLGIGIDSPIGKVQVDTTGLTPIGKALLILNQAENQDILTASASGSTVLTVANSGNITTSGTVTLPNSNTLTGTTNYTQFSKGVSVGNATTFFFDTSGNLNANAGTFASTVTLPNSNTLTGVANFLQANNGFSVGGATTYYFNSSGTINANAETLASTLTLPNSNVLTGLSNYVQFAKGVSVGNATTFFFDTSGNINANAGTFASTIAANGGLINSTGALNITPGGALTVGSTSQTTTLQGTTTSITSTSGNNISLNSALTVNSSGNLVTTGTADFRNAAGITLGEDKTAGTNNTPGFLKLISAGDNAFSTTFTTGTQTGNVNYTLPTADGSNNFVLTTNGSGVLAWSSVSGVGGVNGTGASGQVTFWNGTSSITGNNNFFFDSTNTKLGIGTNSPLGRLGVDSTSLSPIGKALVALNQAENQDILTASASGVTKFTIGIDVASGNLETLTSNTITTGNVISATSSAITSGNLLKLAEGGNQTFSGNAILADIDNTGGGGNAFTGNFLQFNNAGTAKFTVNSSGKASVAVGQGLDTISAGTLNIGTTTTNALALGNGSATFSLSSSAGLNVTTGGALTGVASLDTITTSATALGFAGIGSITSNTNNSLTLDSGTTGTIFLGNGNNAKIINIGTGNAGDTINIGTNNTVADTISIGSALDSLTLSSANWGVSSAGVITLPNSNTLTGVANFVELNNGLSVGGGTTFFFNTSGNINANAGTFASTIAANGGLINSTGALNITPGGALTVGSTSQTTTLQGTTTSITSTSGNNISLNSALTVNSSGNLVTTGTADFRNAAGITLGEDKTAGTNNTPGFLKLISAGDNAFSTTFTTGTQTGNINYTLPTSITNGFILQTDGSGTLTWLDPGTLPASNFFQLVNSNTGIAPINTTRDLLIGGTATSSAKFQAYGIETATGNLETLTSNTITTGSVLSATASAITSGNLLKLAEGGNQTFSGNAILADIDNTGGGGNAFTGNFLKFNNAGSTKLTVNSSGYIGIGVTPTQQITLNGQNSNVTGANGIFMGSNSYLFENTSGTTIIDHHTGAGDVSLNLLDTYAQIVGSGTGVSRLYLTSLDSFGALSLGDTNATSFTFGSTAQNPSYSFLGSGKTGFGTSSPTGRFEVNDNTLTPVNKALVILNQAENQDILSASNSGTNVFKLTNTGNLTLTSSVANADSLLFQPNNTGSNAFTGTITSADLTAARTWTIPDATGTVCLTTGNCAGVGGGVTGSGATGQITYWNTASTVTGSNNLYFDATNVKVGIGVGTSPLTRLNVDSTALSPIGKALVILNQGENQDILSASNSGTTVLTLSNTGNLTLASSVANADIIKIVPQNSGSNTFIGTITTADLGSNETWTFPDATGTVCLTTGNCAGVGGGLTGSGTSGQIAFFNGAGTLTSETTGFRWDSTNKKFGVGTDSPVGKVQFDTTGLTPVNKALLILNQAENQDILTASASGVTKFTLGNDIAAGNLASLTSNTITTGNVISATSSAITSGNLLKLAEGGNQTFSGNAILADIDNTGGGGNAFTGNFLQFNNAGSTKLTVSNTGDITTSGNAAINGGNLTTTQTTASLFNTNATTVSLGGAATTALNLGTGNSAYTAINLGTGTSANGINIGGSGANTIAIGNTQTAGSISLGAAMVGGTISIGGTGAQTGTISLGTGTGAQIINLGTGGTAAKTVTLGSTASTGSTTIQSGSGGIALNSAITIDSSGNLITTANADFRNASGITLGFDTATNVAGNLKFISAGANSFSTTFTAGTQTASVAYTLPTAVAAGNNYVLASQTDGTLSWQSVSGVGGVNGSGATGQITYWNGASSLTGSNNLFYDSTNIKLGIGTNSPLGRLGIDSTSLSPIGKALVTLNQTENQDILTASNSGTTVMKLTNTGNLTLTSSVANADSLLFQPNNTGSNAFTGTLTSTDLTAARTYTLPDSTGTICLSSGNCIGSTNFWQLNGQQLSPINSTYDMVIGGTATSSAKFQAYGVETATGNIASLTSNTITSGNVLSATASAVTTGSIVNLAEGGNQTFSGNAIFADIDNTGGGGNAFTGNFLKFNNAGSTKFTVSNTGDITSSGNAAINGGNLTTTQTTAALFNTNATTLNIGGAATTALNIGNGNSAYTAINLGSGTGGNTINIAGTGATGVDTINIGTGGTSADTVNIGTGGTANTLAIGSTTGTGSLALKSGTGAITLTNTAAGGTIFNTATSTDDQISLLPFIGGAGRFTGTITSVDLTAARTYTLPDATGTICISGQACALSGNVTASGTPLSGRISYFTGDTAVTGDTNFVWNTSTQKFGIGLSSPDAKFQVSGDAIGKALTILNTTSTDQNILVASTSGTNVFQLGRTGNLTLNSSVTNADSLIFAPNNTGSNTFAGTLTSADLTAARTYTLPDTTGTVALTSQLPTQYLQLNSQQLAPANTTWDFMVGATSTASAKFAAFGVETASSGVGAVTSTVTSTGNVFNISGSALTSGNLLNLTTSGNTWTTGNLLNITSTATSLTSGRLLNLDWSPGSTTTATGDLVRLNIGANGNVTNLLNVTNNGSTVFRAAQNQFEVDVPSTFTAAGDVSVSYDLLFSNATSANIKSTAGPLNVIAGPSSSSNNLTLQTYNSGNILLNLAASGGGVGVGNGITPVGLFDVNGAKIGKALVQLNETGDQNILVASASGTNVLQLARSGNLTLNSNVANADSLILAPNNSGSNTFAGTLTSADLTAARTWTLPDATGTICVSGQACSLTGNVTASGTPLSGRISYFTGDTAVTGDTNFVWNTTTQKFGIGLSSPDAKFQVSGDAIGKALAILNSTSTDQNVFVASVSGAAKFAISNAGNILSAAGTKWQPLTDSTTALNVATSNGTSFVTFDTSNQRVGIATSSPTEALQVNGNVFIGPQANSTTAFSRINTAAGQFVTTTNIDNPYAIAPYDGSLFVATEETNAAEIYRYDPNNSTWNKVTQSTAGTIAASGTANIDEIVTMVVYNGYLYAGTFESNSAEIYRYGGGTTWTKVSQATAGTIASGGTANIDGVVSMAVYNGSLYAGTYESGSGEVYRYDGGTTWTKVSQATAGTIASGGTASVDGVASMITYNGSLYIGTSKGTNAGEIYRYDGGTTWTKVSQATAGTIASGGTANLAAVNSLAVYNGALYAGIADDGSNAQVYRYDTTTGTSGTNWVLVSGTGNICGGSNDTGVMSLAVYNGSLYAGTRQSSGAMVCRYDGDKGTNSSTKWTLVSNSSGQISSGAATSQEGVYTMTVLNGKLYVGAGSDTGGNLNHAEVHVYTALESQSYALKFNAPSQNSGWEFPNNYNVGSIAFQGEVQGQSSLGGVSGSSNGQFVFSNSISTINGSYDVAEDYPTRDTTLNPGDVVSIDPNESGFVTKSQIGYDSKMVGIYSEKPGFRLSQADSTINGGTAIPIALAGRVPVNIDPSSPAISAGDYLTSSDKPGLAIKATKAGRVIGTALEAWDPQGGKTKVLTFVNLGFYDPGQLIQNDGNLQIVNQPISTEEASININIPLTYQVTDTVTGQIFDKISAFGEIISGLVKAGTVQTQNLLASIGITTPKVTTQIIKPAENSNLVIDLNNSPTATESGFGKLLVQGTNGNTVASIDESGNATFSGQLTSNAVETNNATVSGELHATKIYADQIITNGATSSANLDLGNITRDQIEQLLTDAQNQLNSMNQMASGWNSNTATSSASVDSLAIQNLFVTDKAAINQVTVSNSVSIGSDMVLQSSLSQSGNAVNSIDTLSQPLLIQSLALAPIQFMAGKVQIDTTGNMTINGNLAVTGTIQSSGLTLQQPDTSNSQAATTSGFGKLLSVLNSQGGEVAGISASGEATFASVTTGKLAVKVDENATQSASQNANIVTSDASAGKAIIPAGQTEITIINSAVKSTDLIYITPTTQTGNNVLFVKTQDGCEKATTNTCKPSFTIAVPNTYSANIDFNWWIVGQQ